MLKAGDSIYTTNNIKLACALLTLGHETIDGENSVFEENGGRQVVFVFKNKDNKVLEAAKKWKEGLSAMGEEEPIAYLYAYAHNRDRLLDMIKSAVPLVRVKRGNKVIVYSKNATKEAKEKVLKLL
jgi:5-deoxy-D-glucuronate isomerase